MTTLLQNRKCFVLPTYLLKVHIFWESHKILQNLHCRFDRYYIGQTYVGDFAQICCLLRIYELGQLLSAWLCMVDVSVWIPCPHTFIQNAPEFYHHTPASSLDFELLFCKVLYCLATTESRSPRASFSRVLLGVVKTHRT